MRPSCAHVIKDLQELISSQPPYDSEADWTETYGWAERAAGVGLGITVHVGEFSTANITSALRFPGIKRIGHGVHAAAKTELLKEVANSGVTVECCLTSNVVLGAVSSLEEHPIRSFIGGASDS